MEGLSAQSFSDALMRCYENKHYKVGVMFASTVTYIPFINELSREYRETAIPGVCDVRASNTSTRIVFQNGSCLDVFVLHENMRGARYNEILYDAMIDIDIYMDILRPMLVPYKNLEDSTEDEFERSEELDKFFSEFKIIEDGI